MTIALIAALVLLAVVVAGLCWLVVKLAAQSGRILVRTDELAERIGDLDNRVGQARSSPIEASGTAPPAGLSLGSIAPDFDLPTLAGRRMTLGQWRGMRVLLLFFDPECPHSRAMVSDIATFSALPTDSRPVPLIISTGSWFANQQLAENQGVKATILLQQQMEVATLFRVPGTPMAYSIDEHGRIASNLAVGRDEILPLAAELAQRPPILPNPEDHQSWSSRPLSPGRVKRDGLVAGITAPSFRLPLLDGGEVSLEQYRGNKLILLFFAPHCEPCVRLAPELERLTRHIEPLQFLMISRGDPDTNREMAREYGFTFPIALQHYHDISREYGTLSEPVGYLIDEQGRISGDIAVGRDAILALAGRAAISPVVRG